MSDQQMVVETGIPTAAILSGDDRVVSGEMYAGKVVTTTHIGPYDTLTEAFRDINARMVSHGEPVARSPWETILSDPAQVAPRDMHTQIYWPIA